jgi:hypothetical protein
VSAPPHSVPPSGAALADERYTERNDFLFLLLGLISTAETVLRVAPDLVPTDPAHGRAPPAARDDDGLMR